MGPDNDRDNSAEVKAENSLRNQELSSSGKELQTLCFVKRGRCNCQERRA